MIAEFLFALLAALADTAAGGSGGAVIDSSKMLPSVAALQGPVATQTFSTPGTKTVTLQVCNSGGCSSVQKTLTVLDPKPRILSETVPATIGLWDPPSSFTATVGGRPPVVQRWTVTAPDGATESSIANPFSWAPRLVGAHQVGLTVSNLDGVGTVAVPLAVVPSVYSDVSPAGFAGPQIEALSFAGITAGCGVGPLGRPAFCPGNPLSRAEIAVFLVRSAHPASFSPPPPSGVFRDVPPSYFAAAWIEQAYRDGTMLACSVAGSTRLFCPESLVSRSDMAVFLERASHPAGFVPPQATGIFADVPPQDPAAPWIELLYRDGITGGCAGAPVRLFCPAATLTRAEMAVFLDLAFHLDEKPLPQAFLARLCSGSSCSYPAGMPIDFNVQLRGGIPASYDFDWNGDGVYEESAPFPVPHLYSTPGTYTPHLRLRRGNWSAVLVHPFVIHVLPAVTSSPLPPASWTATADGSVPAGPDDPPGTPDRIAYRISIPLQAGLLGYALFVQPGTPGSSYQFAGLLAPNRATAADRLLLAPGVPGAVRYLYVRAFNAIGYGPASLPVRLP